CTPPRSTITRASTERGTERTSGEIEPLENANSAPATPARVPAMVNAAHCTARTGMPTASARSGESRAARSAKPKGEKIVRQTSATAAPQRTGASEKYAGLEASQGAGHTPINPFEPPVTVSHWNATDQTICEKARVSM